MPLRAVLASHGKLVFRDLAPVLGLVKVSRLERIRAGEPSEELFPKWFGCYRILQAVNLFRKIDFIGLCDLVVYD